MLHQQLRQPLANHIILPRDMTSGLITHNLFQTFQQQQKMFFFGLSFGAIIISFHKPALYNLIKRLFKNIIWDLFKSKLHYKGILFLLVIEFSYIFQGFECPPG